MKNLRPVLGVSLDRGVFIKAFIVTIIQNNFIKNRSY